MTKTKDYYVKKEIAVKTAAKVTGVDAKIIRAGMKKDATVAPEHKKAVNLAKQIWFRYRKAYAVANQTTQA